MKRTATAQWQGTGKEGKGTLSAPSGVLKNTPYNFTARFENAAAGTSPEELIAAAHAGCYSMKLSFILGAAGATPDSIDTSAAVTIENGTVTESHLDVSAKVPGIDAKKFAECAEEAKTTCPVSKALNAKVTMEAKLVN